MKKPSIMVAVPAGGEMVNVATVVSLYSMGEWLTKMGISHGLKTFSAADIEDIRNLFVTAWYDATTYSHLLFVDADMGFSPELIRDMINFNKPLMGCLYARRNMNPSVVGTVPDGHSINDVQKGFIRASGLGCGVMMISREVIKTMLEKMPELNDPHGAYLMDAVSADVPLTRIIRAFDKIRTPTHRLSEDMAFCHRWLECGGEIWANINHKISHIGKFDYHLRYQGVLERKAEAAKAAA
jgi:hypothetical protein